MKRVVTKLGNVFAVKLDGDKKKYFQYVANDLSQLNSDVIRVFKTIYPVDDESDLSKVVEDEVEFYAHTMVSLGVKRGFWEKIGKAKDIGKVEVHFRDSEDYGVPEIKISKNWYVWKINKEFRDVGKLQGEYRKAEIGIVVNPIHIVHRIRTGEYDFLYPGYE